MGGGWRGLHAGVRPAARLYLIGSALIGGAHTVTWTLLARYLDAIGMTKSQIGLVQSFDSWGKVAVAIPAAIYLARRPARPAFVASALVGGAAYALLPWLSDLRAICAVNLVAGFAMTLHYVAIAPFLYRHTGPGERAMVFGLAEAVRTLAAVLGALAAGSFVALSQGWLGSEARAIGWAICAAGVVSMLAAGVYGRIQDDAPSMARGEPLLPVLKRHRGLLARFALPQFVMACGAGFCIPFLTLYFKDRFGLTTGGWGILFAAGQVLMTLGFLATPIILRRLGFVRSIVTIELCSIPFFLLLAFTMDVRLAMVAFLMRGALMNATHPLHKNLMMQATPPGAREMQTGINATLWGVGWVIGPLAAGRVLDATGNDYTVLMLTTVGLYLLAAVLTWILLSPVERRSREFLHIGGSVNPRPANKEGA